MNWIREPANFSRWSNEANLETVLFKFVSDCNNIFSTSFVDLCRAWKCVDHCSSCFLNTAFSSRSFPFSCCSAVRFFISNSMAASWSASLWFKMELLRSSSCNCEFKPLIWKMMKITILFILESFIRSCSVQFYIVLPTEVPYKIEKELSPDETRMRVHESWQSSDLG